MPQTSLSSWLKKPQIPPVTSTSKDTTESSLSSREQTSFPEVFQDTTRATATSPRSSTNHDRHTTAITSTSPTPSHSTTSESPSHSSASFLRALQPTLQPLPTPVSFAPMTADSMNALRRLTALLLPIPYPQSFYDEILADPVSNHITLLAFWDPHATPPDKDPSSLANLSSKTTTPPSESTIPTQPRPPRTTSTGTPLLPTAPPTSQLVAAIRCRIYPHPLENATPSPDTPPILYISTLVLLPTHRSYGIATHLLAHVLARALQTYNVTAVTAHVWSANEEGRAWYKARGFEEQGVIPGYYRRLKPQDAVLVRREIGVADYGGGVVG